MKVFTLFVSIVCLYAVANAQETRGQILGRVTDESGAVVVGASVTAVNVATNVASKTTTNDSGDYTLPFLIPGTYNVTSELKGFKSFEQEGILVRVADKATLNMVLQIGQTTDRVLVTADAPLIETATASMGQVVDNRRISELPLKDGNPIMLASLAPGVLNLSTGGWSRPFDNSSPSSIAVNGSRTATNEFTLDGAPNTQRGNVAYIPPSEAVQEFRIQTATFDAATGYSAGAVVNVSLKSGTNTLHGSAYEFLQNTKLNANDYFSNLNKLPRTQLRLNRWGGTLSGPVILPKLYDGRNKTFWMYAYEGINDAAPDTAYSFAVPTAKQRQGDFSDLLKLGPQYQIYDPATTTPAANGRFTRQPFPDNIIPANRINPTGKAIMSALPLPNQAGSADGSDNWYTPGPSSDTFYSHLFRVDHSLSDKHRFFVRADLNHRIQDYVRWYNNDANGSLFYRRNRGATLDDVYVFSPSFLMNLRYSYSRFYQGDDPVTRQASLSSLGFSQSFTNLVTSIDPRGLKFPFVTTDGSTELSRATYSFRYDDTHDFAVNLTRIVRNHSIRFGTGFRVYRENSFDFGQASGNFAFTSGGWVAGPFDNSPGAPLGQGFAAMLLGLPNSGSIDVNGNYAEQSRIWSGFVQDDWKLSRKLTVNLGLRYEIEFPTTERYNRTVTGFDATTPNPLQAAAQANYAKNPIPQIPADQFRVLGGLQFAGVNGAPRGLWSTDTNNLMPRIGGAYAIDSKTVIRGGFGIFYEQIGILRRNVNQTGFNRSTDFVASLDNGQTFIANLTNPFPNGVNRPLGSGLGLMTNAGQSISFFNNNLSVPFMRRWEAGLQRQLPAQAVLEIAYVGNVGSNLRTSRQLDPIPRQYLSSSPVRDQAAIDFLSTQVANPFYPLLPRTSLSGSNVSRSQLLRPYPEFTSITRDTNEGYSRYHSLQTRLEKRMSAGYTVNVSWTWSKFLEATSFLNETDPVPERVISDQDRTHRVVISGLWELPFGKGRRFAVSTNPILGKLLEGWQTQAIYQFQSGAPLGFGNAIFNGNLADIPLPAGERTIYRWFNTSAGFERTSNRQLASNLRTLSTRFSGIRGDGLNNWDISLVKNTSITERVRLQFRTEFINALNHAQFSNPNTTPTSSSFGRVTATSQWPRTIQFGLKLLF
ncbi:MAG TPA: carboxypeptidase regulatory-like domain-containing protein [Bryobacteraceae bacterium]|nr:carboxypeptidase regulatory-like domain-containing protein [Bryobacteraceae bacterium]